MDGRKPIFQEQGPYSFKFVLLPIVVIWFNEIDLFPYRQYRKREILSFSEDKSIVKFNEEFKFVFNKEESASNYDTPMTLINPIYIVSIVDWSVLLN